MNQNLTPIQKDQLIAKLTSNNLKLTQEVKKLKAFAQMLEYNAKMDLAKHKRLVFNHNGVQHELNDHKLKELKRRIS